MIGTLGHPRVHHRLTDSTNARARGDYARADELLVESLAMAREIDDSLEMARSLGQLARAAQETGRPARAEPMAAEALERF